MRPACSRFLVLASVLCCSSPIAVAQQPIPDGTPSYVQFADSIREFPYYASPERILKIKRGLAQIERCMSKSQIQSLLGTPDFGQVSYGPKGPGERWLGSSWTYYLSMRSTSVNENDSTVQVCCRRPKTEPLKGVLPI